MPSVEQAMSMLELAAATESPHWKANVAAARAFIGEQARHVGHEAIQMHGGMGLSDELAVSHFHKRIAVLGLMFGDRTDHTDRFLEARDLVGGQPTDTTLPLAQLLTAEEPKFQSEVREFLRSEAQRGNSHRRAAPDEHLSGGARCRGLAAATA